MASTASVVEEEVIDEINMENPLEIQNSYSTVGDTTEEFTDSLKQQSNGRIWMLSHPKMSFIYCDFLRSRTSTGYMLYFVCFLVIPLWF